MRQYMNNIIANEALRNRLCGDVLEGRLSHAYIIEGGKGSGKHTVAMLTAAALACEEKKNSELPLPCMNCPSCRKILQGLSPDIIKVGTEEKATIGVDTVRFLKEDVSLVPNDLEHKVYIIEDADKMTDQAQNAFLLTLEEPPSYVVFFLLCENSERFLETIKSRAPILRTEPIPKEMIDEYITRADRRAAQMKASSPNDYYELLVSCDNGIGRALELLDSKKLFPLLEVRKLAKDFVSAAVYGCSNENALRFLKRFSQKRDALAKEFSSIYLALRDLFVSKKSYEAELCFYESREQVLELCDNVSIADISRLTSAVSSAIERLERNSNVRLTITLLLSETGLI